jgi:hypothetical protein
MKFSMPEKWAYILDKIKEVVFFPTFFVCEDLKIPYNATKKATHKKAKIDPPY